VTVSLTLFILGITSIHAQGFTTLTPINPIVAEATTGEKPQSKVWNYNGYWWAVIPISLDETNFGTYLFRLDGNSWNRILRLSRNINVKADTKISGDKAYIILVPTSSQTSSSPKLEFLILQSVPGSPPTYNYNYPSDPVNNPVEINLDSFCEIATIDLDSQNRIWIASDGGGATSASNKNIYVRWCDSPGYVWSSPILLQSGVNFDDICAITAFSDNSGSKIGVMWSNQSDQITNEWRYGFKYHLDGGSPGVWSSDELGTYGDGGKFADDHINFTVNSDGTLYAAIKTGYDGVIGKAQIALMVRRPDQTWDPFYKVTDAGNPNFAGTRPIVILNEAENFLDVIYAEKVGGNDIVYKESDASSIFFPTTSLDIIRSNTDYDDVSCTKDAFTDKVVIVFSERLAAGISTWHGVIAEKLPPFIVDINNGAGLALKFDGLNDRIDFAPNSSLNIIGPITIEGWINPSTFTGRGYILEKYIGSIGGYDLGFQDEFNADYISFRIGSGASNSQINSSTIPLNVWTHIAAVYDGVTIKIYLNGTLNVSGNAITSFTNSGTNMIIGANNTGSGIGDYFDGSMDEVRLWSAARTEDEIRENMCRKLTGAQPNLVGYWAFNKLQVTGTSVSTSVYDYNNINNGTRTNFVSTIPGGYEWSGAPVGDVSSYDYNLLGGYSPTLAHPDGDFIAVAATGGTVDGIQVYYTNASALTPAISALGLSGSTSSSAVTDPHRYWGVKTVGSTVNPPTYTLTYYYDGHPGIINETDLKLVYRNNLSDNSWEDLLANLNTTTKTLTKSGLIGTEYALASSGDPLPVELSLFNAVKTKIGVQLVWRTETEVNNFGFEVERNTPLPSPYEREGDEAGTSTTLSVTGWEKIGFVSGNGNSNSPKNYSFLDESKLSSGTIYYRLKQIDNDGQYEYSKEISVDLGVPSTFSLSQNYPNPFNPSTKISYTLPIDTKVSIKVYDILGNLVETLIDEQKEAGYYEANFNVQGLSSGIYFYTISADNFNQTKKMTLLK